MNAVSVLIRMRRLYPTPGFPGEEMNDSYNEYPGSRRFRIKWTKPGLRIHAHTVGYFDGMLATCLVIMLFEELLGQDGLVAYTQSHWIPIPLWVIGFGIVGLIVKIFWFRRRLR